MRGYALKANPLYGILVIKAAAALLTGCLADDVDVDDPVLGEPQTFTVTGFIEGLGTEAEVILNDDETITLLPNNEFTFDTELAEGEAYEVDLVEQPDGHQCEVENGTGVISDDVDDVLVECAVLEAEAVTIEADSIAATVNWEETGATDYDIYWSSRPDFNPEDHGVDADTDLMTSVTPPVEVEDLDPDTNYYFRIRAVAGVEDRLGGVWDTQTRVPGLQADVNDLHQTEDGRILLAHDPAAGTDMAEGYVSENVEVLDKTSGERRAHPRPDGLAAALAEFDNGDLLLGGGFEYLDGELVPAIARVDEHGQADPDWGPDVDPGAGEHLASVAAAAVDSERDRVYIAGSFNLETPDGNHATDLAALDAETGEVTEWGVEVSDVQAMHVHDAYLYIGGSFTEVTETDTGNTVNREALAEFDLDDKSVTDWAPDPGGSIMTVAVLQDDNGLLVFTGRGFNTGAEVWDEDGESADILPDYVEDGFTMVATVADDRMYLTGDYEDNSGTVLTAVQFDPSGTVTDYWEADQTGYFRSTSRDSDGELFALAYDVATDVTSMVRVEPEGQVQTVAELHTDEPPWMFHPAGDRLAVTGAFRLIDARDSGVFSVLGEDLSWERDWPRVLGARAHGLDVDDDRIYVAGAFNEAEDSEDTYDRNNVAAIDRDEKLVAEDWPQVFPSAGNPSGITVLSNGNILAYGGTRAWEGDTDYANMVELDVDGEFARQHPRLLEEGESTNTFVHSVSEDVSRGKLYFGGNFNSLELPDGSEEDREQLARLDLSDSSESELDDWGEDLTHDASRIRSVEHYGADSDTLYIGADSMTEMESQTRVNAAALSAGASDDAELDDDWDPAVDSARWVFDISRGQDGELVLAGELTGFQGADPGDLPLAAVVDFTDGQKARRLGEGDETATTRSSHTRDSDGRTCVGLDGQAVTEPEYYADYRLRLGFVCYTADNELAW